MFIKEGDKRELCILGIEESRDGRGLFLADCDNKKVKYFNRDTEAMSVLCSSDFEVLNVLLLADGSVFVTFECSKTGLFFEF